MFKYGVQSLLKNNFYTSRHKRFLSKSQLYPLNQLREYQDTQLQKIIKLCYHSIEFYKEIFDQHKLSINDIKTSEDLKKLPILNKNTIRANYKKLINKNFRGPRFKASTSGTTGSPCTFLRDLSSINFEQAAIERHYQWGGRKTSARKITLRGDLIFPSDRQNPPYWKYNPFQNELILSAYHLSQKTINSYINVIEQFKAQELHAYPSTAYFLAQLCDTNRKQLNFERVYCSSEMVYEHQRDYIQNQFQSKVCDWYGNAERNAAIGQCEYGSYHEIMDYSIQEHQPKDDGTYEIIGTTLHNYIMPLLRYRTHDLIKKDPTSNRCRCGRHFPVIKHICGRETNYIATPEGRKVSIFNHIPRNISHLLELQLIQSHLDEVQVKIVTANAFTRREEDELLARLKKYISHKIQFKIDKVQSIERTRSGKFQSIIQNIKEESLV